MAQDIRKSKVAPLFIVDKSSTNISNHCIVLLENSYQMILDYLVSFQHIITILIYNTTR